MKRFFSLMLVALLLVSVLPFQAFAAGKTCKYCGNENLKLINNPTYTKEVTCVTDGVELYECQNESCKGWNTFEVKAPGKHDIVETITKAPTCKEAGSKDITCSKGCTDPIQLNVVIPKVDHKLPATGTVTTPAACGEPGVLSFACEYGCGYVKTEEIDALEHTWNAGVVTKDPTCVEPGVKTFTCTRTGCGATKTEPIPATGIHTYENGECECGAAEDANDTNSNYALTFHYKNANGNWTSSMLTVKPGQAITLPNIPSVSGYRHTGWNTLSNGTGDSITSATRWYNGMARDIYATYVESTDDGLVDLTVYAHYYVDGVYHHKVRLYVESFKESKSNTMHNWLYSDAGMAKTRAALAAEGYQWDPEKYYDYYDDGEVTTADLKSDGDKAVYVKVGSQKAIEATVLLHVHTKKEYAIARTITMPGYTAGDYVAKADALAAVKKFYTGNNMSMSDLYTDSQWEDLLDGKNSSGKYSVKVETNGTTEIHVILSNATAKSSSKADTTNPKTGDYITIAVGTMVLAAAAVVTLAEMKKRKMI